MKKIEELIEKYYQGETSLEEENMLKSKLSSDETEYDDISTRLLFTAFSEEKNEPAPPSVKTLSFLSKNHKTFSFYRNKWLQLVTGAAACLCIMFGLFYYKHTQANNAYVIINGVRINDEKLALQYIQESFEEEERFNTMALAQLEEMEQIENELNNVENQINEIINNYY